jgi:predicted MFS family arabinose efflux permease
MLIASIAFGYVYDHVSPSAAFVMGAALSAAAAVLLLVVRLPNSHQTVAITKS